MEVKPGYKLTVVGVIPEDWEVKRLGDELMSSPKYGINAAAVPFNQNLPVYIRITDISEDGLFCWGNTVSVNSPMSINYVLRKGDILVARTGASVGKSYEYNENDGLLVFAGFLLLLKPDPSLLVPNFLAAYLKTGSYWNWIRLTSMRSGQPGVNGREYAGLLVPLPSLPEQTAIATALSDVDSLISSLDALISKKKQIKQGAMQELLSGKRRLPGFSGEWEVKRLGDVGEIITGKTPKTEVKKLWGHEFPWVTPTDISNSRDIFETSRHISNEGLKSIKELSTDTVLVTCIASIGKNAILKSKGGCNQQINAILPNDWYSSKYFYYLFEDRVSFLKSKAGTTATSMISKRTFQELCFTIPPLPEQQAIAAILSDMDAEITTLESRRNKTKLLKQGMMQELLTGRIRLIPPAAHAVSA